MKLKLIEGEWSVEDAETGLRFAVDAPAHWTPYDALLVARSQHGEEVGLCGASVDAWHNWHQNHEGL